MFKLNSDLDVGGTYLIGHITISPAQLMGAFGKPQDGDGHKTAGEYSFTGPNGSRFTLYDWKYGYNVWDKRSKNPITINIGGDLESLPDLDSFKAWLRNS